MVLDIGYEEELMMCPAKSMSMEIVVSSMSSAPSPRPFLAEPRREN